MSTPWKINTDGGSRGNPGPSACAFVVSEAGQTLHQESRFLGQKTNNEAEYYGFIDSVLWLLAAMKERRPSRVEWQLDSKLVVEQLNQRWKVKEPRIHALFTEARQLLATLTVPYEISYVPRSENAAPDALLNQALDAATTTY